MVCLGNGVYRISGVPRMHERPQKAGHRANLALNPCENHEKCIKMP